MAQKSHRIATYSEVAGGRGKTKEVKAKRSITSEVGSCQENGGRSEDLSRRRWQSLLDQERDTR